MIRLFSTWIGVDWINDSAATGASGWDLNAGDRFFVADVDNDNADELVVSPNGQWIGILEFQGDRFQATWIGNDWVNPPGQAGPTGWDLAVEGGLTV